MPDESRLEEQALSQAVGMGISSQMYEVEKIDVDVRTDWLKIVLGKADSISVTGSGLSVQKDIRVQEMHMHVDEVVLNPFSAIFGQIKLDQPIDITVRIVLTEEDINRALKSDYIKAKLLPLEFGVDNQIVTVKLELPLSLHLPGDGKVEFTGNMLVYEAGKNRQIGFHLIFLPPTQKHPLQLQEFRCTPGIGVSLELATAFLHKLKEILNLPYFELDEMALRIKEFSVQESSLMLIAEAHIYQMPSS